MFPHANVTTGKTYRGSTWGVKRSNPQARLYRGRRDQRAFSGHGIPLEGELRGMRNLLADSSGLKSQHYSEDQS